MNAECVVKCIRAVYNNVLLGWLTKVPAAGKSHDTPAFTLKRTRRTFFQINMEWSIYTCVNIGLCVNNIKTYCNILNSCGNKWSGGIHVNRKEPMFIIVIQIY